jgi:phosphotransferase system HPr (HPr) family protein
MEKFKVTVINQVGLHARPASLFVQSASLYESEIMIRNITTDEDFVDAKSILGVLLLGVEKGHDIEVVASGEDELEATEVLRALIESDFQVLPDDLSSTIEE